MNVCRQRLVNIVSAAMHDTLLTSKKHVFFFYLCFLHVTNLNLVRSLLYYLVHNSRFIRRFLNDVISNKNRPKLSLFAVRLKSLKQLARANFSEKYDYIIGTQVCFGDPPYLTRKSFPFLHQIITKSILLQSYFDLLFTP